MSEDKKDNSSFLKRYIALRALRENIFAKHPTAYSFLDVAEDIPGGARALGPFVSDLLPSAGIISRDSNTRAQQVAEAGRLIREARDQQGSVKDQALKNMLYMGLGGIPAGALVSGITRILGFRSPISPSNGAWRSPVTAGRNIQKLLNSAKYRQILGNTVLRDSLKGAVLAGATGAAIPIVSRLAKPGNVDIAAAERILNKAPVASALPGGDILAAVRDPKDIETPGTLASLGAGAGLGAGIALVGTGIPPALEVPNHLISAAAGGKPAMPAIRNSFSKAYGKNLLLNTALLSSLGALAGLGVSGVSHANEQNTNNQPK
jgi:hypothetical protein